MLSTVLLIGAGVCFVLEAIGAPRMKWWALGVALYLFAQVS